MRFFTGAKPAKTDLLARVSGVDIWRGLTQVLLDVTLDIRGGDRILLTGENGAGKSTLLNLLAQRLHPKDNRGVLVFDAESNADIRAARRNVLLVSREEGLRLARIHAGSTVYDFLCGHLDGQDFLYRDALPAEIEQIESVIRFWKINPLRDKSLARLSFGELRLVLLARSGLHLRKLYLLDEIFSGLSREACLRVEDWLHSLPAAAAVVLISHDPAHLGAVGLNRWLHIEAKRVTERPLGEIGVTILPTAPDAVAFATNSPSHEKRLTITKSPQPLIVAQNAYFYHDFTLILRNTTFTLHTGARILLTGPNGSGKSTLLRVMHGDFRPAFGEGSLDFVGALAHTERNTLWNKVAFVAASQFSYFPESMSVLDILASRLSGSLYEYPSTLPVGAMQKVEAFGLLDFLDRPFVKLSEGEKTRVLLVRAFLREAVLYLIDEGLMALSPRNLDLAIGYLNTLSPEAAVVLALHERQKILYEKLSFRLTRWNIDAGYLFH